MAVLKIALMGNPVLKGVAEPVSDIKSPEVVTLLGHLEDTLVASGSNGLAAPQVGLAKRIILYRISPHKLGRDSTVEPLPLRALINPRLTPLSDEKVTVVERCLSIPGLHGQVPRYSHIRVEALSADGTVMDFAASGYHASLLQHECDHLDGILYPMRMTDMSTLGFNSEFGKTLAAL